jgi:hypothetical protein
LQQNVLRKDLLPSTLVGIGVGCKYVHDVPQLDFPLDCTPHHIKDIDYADECIFGYYTAAQQIASEKKLDNEALQLLYRLGTSLDRVVYGAAEGGHNKLVHELLDQKASLKLASYGAIENGDIELIASIVNRGELSDLSFCGQFKRIIYYWYDLFMMKDARGEQEALHLLSLLNVDFREALINVFKENYLYEINQEYRPEYIEEQEALRKRKHDQKIITPEYMDSLLERIARGVKLLKDQCMTFCMADSRVGKGSPASIFFKNPIADSKRLFPLIKGFLSNIEELPKDNEPLGGASDHKTDKSQIGSIARPYLCSREGNRIEGLDYDQEPGRCKIRNIQ